MGLTATIKTATQKTTTTTKTSHRTSKSCFFPWFCVTFLRVWLQWSTPWLVLTTPESRKAGEESDPSVHTCGIHGMIVAMTLAEADAPHRPTGPEDNQGQEGGTRGALHGRVLDVDLVRGRGHDATEDKLSFANNSCLFPRATALGHCLAPPVATERRQHDMGQPRLRPMGLAGQGTATTGEAESTDVAVLVASVVGTAATTHQLSNPPSIDTTFVATAPPQDSSDASASKA